MASDGTSGTFTPSWGNDIQAITQAGGGAGSILSLLTGAAGGPWGVAAMLAPQILGGLFGLFSGGPSLDDTISGRTPDQFGAHSEDLDRATEKYKEGQDQIFNARTRNNAAIGPLGDFLAGYANSSNPVMADRAAHTMDLSGVDPSTPFLPDLINNKWLADQFQIGTKAGFTQQMFQDQFAQDQLLAGLGQQSGIGVGNALGSLGQIPLMIMLMNQMGSGGMG